MMPDIRPPRLLVLAVLLCSAGCAQIPFHQVEMCSVEGVDPVEARNRFEDAVPRDFNLVNSVVFEFRGRKLLSLGMIAVDIDNGSFRLVCLTPIGVKTLDIAGDRDGTTCEFALEGFLDARAEREDLARAMGEDIRRMYFDLTPPPDAMVRKERNTIIFESLEENECVEHVFAGPDAVLIEKRYFKNGSRVCRVGFYEYVRQAEKLYPAGIVLDNRRFGYRLIVRLTEIRRMNVESS